ncbi:glycine betaine ABC transporter substrate-binding protein [Micromonospora sp. C28ISP2-4]|uniref:glycine betaine ABC transporter substrate-binding protein n=1 Tax=Micromonospora sp. C28ISP2-4 TaxID=3059523 RepID=UPI002675DC1C|nr:glycine betaine ABC transporter substrate-binding protein [Micromonospora sp. C28ISP2-4]MDO3684888.1 glycine betaine ABC transporter substrate-binding protein [Micromonospora sp. C28ISP2-4]
MKTATPLIIDGLWTTEDRAVAACHSVDVDRWRVILDEAVTGVAGRFVRAKPHRTAGQFVEGLLSGLERKTCWSLAERAGHGDPQAMQRLLRTAVWEADTVRDDVRAWVFLAYVSMKLKPSSTPAMLAALDGVIADKKPIVVTLWHPHWYAKYELKDLADRKGTPGAAAQINTFGRKGFGKDFPEVTKMLQQFKMDSQQLASLEDLMFNTHKGDEKKAVEEWLKPNPDYLKSPA